MSIHRSTQAFADDDGDLLTRLDLARRWKVSIETVKRREQAKILRPVRLDGRVIRYRLSDIRQIEAQGSDWSPEE
jgi:hypothetical protein